MATKTKAELVNDWMAKAKETACVEETPRTLNCHRCLRPWIKGTPLVKFLSQYFCSEEHLDKHLKSEGEAFIRRELKK